MAKGPPFGLTLLKKRGAGPIRSALMINENGVDQLSQEDDVPL